MSAGSWTRTKRAFGLVMQACALAALWTLVAFAWCIRKTATPAAKWAGNVEAWALNKLRGEK